MSVPLGVSVVAAAFWQAVGGPEPFPRTLRGAIVRTPFDLTVKELPALGLRAAERYLTRQGVGWACREADRALRACLMARDGVGFILLDAGDAAAERTFSLAHELAHFLIHYWGPRGLVGRRLGGGVVAVFEGQRPAKPGERVQALVAGVSLGVHVHLMERGPSRTFRTADDARAEDEADRLAWELLAPAGIVASRVGEVRGERGRARVAAALRDEFGLPAAAAADYARLLVPPLPDEPLLRRLGWGS